MKLNAWNVATVDGAITSKWVAPTSGVGVGVGVGDGVSGGGVGVEVGEGAGVPVGVGVGVPDSGTIMNARVTLS